MFSSFRAGGAPRPALFDAQASLCSDKSHRFNDRAAIVPCASTVHLARTITGGLLDLLFPRACAACDVTIDESGMSLCADCAAKLAATISPDYCSCCAQD